MNRYQRRWNSSSCEKRCPGNASNSVIPFRMGTNDVTARMPPIARSVTHEEAVVLIEQWINTVVDSSYEGADSCAGGGWGGLFGMLQP